MNMELGREARRLALAAHGDQKYGADPYATHLDEVVAVLREFNHPELEAAGYLHDVLEDTKVRVPDLLMDGIPQEVLDDVAAVTGTGPNRKSRNDSIYAQLALRPRAVNLKLADRIANVRRSLRPDGKASAAEMYRREYPKFRANLVAWGDPLMWAELDRLLTLPCRSG